MAKGRGVRDLGVSSSFVVGSSGSAGEYRTVATSGSR
jgi:hypothetical protein